MPVQKTRIDLFPKSGMDQRSSEGIKWLRNVRRWTEASPLEVRPGFGQKAQLDSTVSMVVPNTKATQGYKEHLGSYLYRSHFNHRQILSLFTVSAAESDSTETDLTTTGGVAVNSYLQLHGVSNGVVFSIFDLTTLETWEELLPFKTSEFAESDLSNLFGHFEANRKEDSRGFRYLTNTDVSFAQIGDSVYFSNPDIGTWVYRGIDVGQMRNRQRLCSNNPDPAVFAGAPYKANNNHNGYSEGSVIKPVVPTPGINGKDVVYLERGDMPRSVGMANIGGRMAFTSRDVIWFSDVNQPASVMASNFAAYQSDGLAVAIASHKHTLFVFSPIEVHAFVLRPANSAGSPLPGVIDVVRVETSKEAGCVSSRSHCSTPYGVCFVSSWGVHFVSHSSEIQTVSDQIFEHWMDGLLDPRANFHKNNGRAGTPGTRQTPIRYFHEGKPTVTYSGDEDVVYICYETHILVYNVGTKGWGIWPLGGTDQDTTKPIGHLPSFTGLAVVSDIEGDYLISGFYDLNASISENPYNESPSYVIAELGFGGGVDRTIVNEDQRQFGAGHNVILRPLAAFAGGTPPPIMDKTTSYVKNGWLLFVDPVDEWVDYSGATVSNDRQKYKSYDISFWVTENSDNPNTVLKTKLKIDAGTGWSFVASEVGTHPEAGTKTGFTIALSGTDELHITTPSFAGGTRGPRRIPLIRFAVAANTDEANDPIFQLLACEANAPISTTLYAIRAMIWQAADRMRFSNQKWTAASVGAAAGGQKVPAHAFDGASQHERPIEWNITTGLIGSDDGLRHRIRDIRTELKTSGPDNPTANYYDGLFNASVATDYKMLSGQRQDYLDPYVASREIQKKETIRNRLSAYKRIFSDPFVTHNAKWSDGTGASPGADFDYIIDEPEVNEIAISTHGKGDSVMAMLYGITSTAGSYLSIQKIFAVVQHFKGNRRKGR